MEEKTFFVFGELHYICGVENVHSLERGVYLLHRDTYTRCQEIKGCISTIPLRRMYFQKPNDAPRGADIIIEVKREYTSIYSRNGELFGFID